MPTPPSASPDVSEEATLSWTRRHVIDSSDLRYDEVRQILKTARTFSEILQRPVKKVPTLRGQVVVTMFYENSTRTRTSFELAAKYLSADTVNFAVSSSSVKKGESLYDTLETLLAMGCNALVIRHGSSGVCQQIVRRFGDAFCVINAGDGHHDHPTQGLLDLYTLTQRIPDLCGKKIVLVGDIAHSRVARSNIHILQLFGAHVHVVAPPTLLPRGIASLGCQVHTDLAPALTGADAVMCLRLQLERQESGLLPSLLDYSDRYLLNRERFNRYCSPETLRLNPGPMKRRVEIDSDLADDPRISVISHQVTSGVAVRMAVLYLTLGVSSSSGPTLQSVEPASSALGGNAL